MLSETWSLLRQTINEWFEDGAPRLGAALAYYSVFSIGPLLLIAIGVASLIFDSGMVEREVMGQVGRLIGDQGAQAVQAMISNASIGNRSTIGTLLGIALLLFGAVAVVVQLKDALNIIWNVQEPQASGVWGYTRKYVLSLAAVLGFGFLLTISLLTTTVIGAAGKYWGSGVPEGMLAAVNFVVDFGVLMLLFAMMFKWLPDIQIAWRDVWTGAALTALLFIFGKFLIAFYLGRQGLESTFGAASSIVLILVWIYYSAQLVFFGAEFTQVYARRHGSHAEISERVGRISRKPQDSKLLVVASPHVARSVPYVALFAMAAVVGWTLGAIGHRARSALG